MVRGNQHGRPQSDHWCVSQGPRLPPDLLLGLLQGWGLEMAFSEVPQLLLSPSFQQAGESVGFSKCGPQTCSINITRNLLEMQIVSTPHPPDQRWLSSNLSSQALQAILLCNLMGTKG